MTDAPTAQPDSGGNPSPEAPPPPGHGLAVASLSLGILAVVFLLLFPLAMILGVLALVFGLVARRQSDRVLRMATWGASLGGVALLLPIVAAATLAVVIFTIDGEAESSEPGTVDVLVVRTPIEMGTAASELNADTLRFQRIPSGWVPQDAVEDLDAAEDMVLASSLEPGDVLKLSDFSPRG